MHASLSSAATSSQDDDLQETFARTIEEQRPALQHYLRRRLHNAEDLPDAVQETYARLLRYRTTHTVELPQALLFRIAEHVALDFARKAATHHVMAHRALDESEALLPSDEPSHECRIAAEQELALLLDGVERLAPKCRHVFVLSRVHGLSYLQIAERCGISVKMVEKHMNRALSQLRTLVGDRFRDAP